MVFTLVISFTPFAPSASVLLSVASLLLSAATLLLPAAYLLRPPFATPGSAVGVGAQNFGELGRDRGVNVERGRNHDGLER